MRRLRYNIAMSLDGYIAPGDESTDWITQDATIDFHALYKQFDTFVMGRKTYEVMKKFDHEPSPLKGYPRENVLIVSKTLQPSDDTRITIVSEDFLSEIERLKEKEGKDIWLFGGGQLFGACLDAGLVDTIEVAIIPKMLRGGIKMAPESALCEGRGGLELQLQGVQKLESGIMMCVYKMQREG